MIMDTCSVGHQTAGNKNNNKKMVGSFREIFAKKGICDFGEIFEKKNIPIFFWEYSKRRA